jgi:hypothetical protein
VGGRPLLKHFSVGLLQQDMGQLILLRRVLHNKDSFGDMLRSGVESKHAIIRKYCFVGEKCKIVCR